MLCCHKNKRTIGKLQKISPEGRGEENWSGKNRKMNILKDLLNLHYPQRCTISIGSINIGDYVFVSKYEDADPNDPWAVGFVDAIGTDRKGDFIHIRGQERRPWRNAIKIDKETGNNILNTCVNFQ